TPQAFFEALKPADVEGGFANRAMLLPFEGIKRPPEKDVPEGSEEPPKELVDELMKLVPTADVYAIPVSQLGEVALPVGKEQRVKIGWGNDEAKALYFQFSGEIDALQEVDKRKFQLGMRAPENAERCATIVAAGCFSPTVDQGDIDWALRWSRVSFEANVGGVQKYMRDYYEFPKFCERVFEFIKMQADGFASGRDLGRAFRRNMKFGNELERVLEQLKKEGLIKRDIRQSRSGPAVEGWRAVKDA